MNYRLGTIMIYDSRLLLLSNARVDTKMCLSRIILVVLFLCAIKILLKWLVDIFVQTRTFDTRNARTCNCLVLPRCRGQGTKKITTQPALFQSAVREIIPCSFNFLDHFSKYFARKTRGQNVKCQQPALREK